MPSKTMEDKVDDLIKLVSGQVEQIDTLKGQLGGIMAERIESAKQIAAVDKMLGVLEQQIKDLRSWRENFGAVDQFKIELALMNKEIENLKHWQEDVRNQKSEWGRRWWTVIVAVFSAIFGGVITYYINLK